MNVTALRNALWEAQNERIREYQPDLREIILTHEQFNEILTDDTLLPYELESTPEGYRFRGVRVRLARPTTLPSDLDLRGVE